MLGGAVSATGRGAEARREHRLKNLTTWVRYWGGRLWKLVVAVRVQQWVQRASTVRNAGNDGVLGAANGRSAATLDSVPKLVVG